MCECFEVVLSAIRGLCCCCGNRNKKKAKRRRNGREGSRSSSKRSLKKESLKVIEKTVSEISDKDLFGKYWITLPLNDIKEPEEYLKTENYELTDQEIGGGGFGIVFRAFRYLDGNREEIAVKVIDLNPFPIAKPSKKKSLNESFKNECFVFSELDQRLGGSLRTERKKVKHDHILTFFDFYRIEYKSVDTDGKDLNPTKGYIFMELATDGTLLSETAKTMNEATVRRYFAQIVYGLEYLHGIKIAHRDLKLENCLLFKSKSSPNKLDVKITDFGLSRVFYKDKAVVLTTKTGGTFKFKAPEILKISIGITTQIDAYRADIWALGVCLYYLLYKTYPFDSEDRKTNFDNMQKNRIPFPKQIPENTLYLKKSDSVVSDLAKELIKKLLVADPNIRPNIAAVKRDEWLVEEVTQTQTITDK